MHYYLSLGSNVSNRLVFIKTALEKLAQFGSIKKKSHLYETEPFGVKEQDDFYNAVIIYESDLSPHELLNKIKIFEKEIGRKKRSQWQAREIDIDILEYQGDPLNSSDLIIPHAQLEKRNFVLYPLRDVADHFFNRQGIEIDTLILRCKDSGKVKRIKTEW